jgi:SagB-type dehydrogenase family enzyme
MRLLTPFLVIPIVTVVIPLTITYAMGERNSMKKNEIVQLPSPALKGGLSVEETISRRRTQRRFSSEALPLHEWGQILWAAQGITSTPGSKKRAAPSAGALYPLDIYLILGKNALPPLGTGVYHYLPDSHALQRLSDEDLMRQIAEASLSQYWMSESPGMILITAEYPGITGKYGLRGIRYAHIEVGHVAQNCFLQAESLGLNAGIVGAFEDDTLSAILPIPKGHEPILILPIGRKIKE